jgi:uncharacterized protein YegJ (DUF2314 family)
VIDMTVCGRLVREIPSDIPSDWRYVAAAHDTGGYTLLANFQSEIGHLKRAELR